MPDDTARALKAPSPMIVKFGDKECQVHALGIRELTEAERECIKSYRRSYLETFAQNVDLLSNGQVLLEKKMEEAARWDVDDLPTKEAYDPAKVRVTDKLKQFVADHFNLEAKTLTDIRIQRFTAALLDQEHLSLSEYKELTKCVIRPLKIQYVNWWITGSYDGMVTFIWLCFRSYGVSKEEVFDKIGKESSLLVELSREIETLSTPAVGNG